MTMKQTATAETDRTSRPSVLSASGLTKVYHSGEVSVHALRGIDLELYPSELIVLLGASGSGKSTLLNILGGLDHPTAGTVFFDGVELSSFGDSASFSSSTISFQASRLRKMWPLSPKSRPTR